MASGEALEFLTLADVIRVHVDQIERYGGRAGVREFRLLQSALAMPQASFGGEWLHRDLYEMAAAYAYHICQDHPFVDGNKRTALTSALVFLELNGTSLSDPEGRLYGAMIEMASGAMDKPALAADLRRLSEEA